MRKSEPTSQLSFFFSWQHDEIAAYSSSRFCLHVVLYIYFTSFISVVPLFFKIPNYMNFVQMVSWLRKNLLLVMTVGSVVLGAILGFVFRGLQLSPQVLLNITTLPIGFFQSIMYISFPGELLMHMLKMMILPLIMSSLISGLAQLDARQSGKLGSLAVTYYMFTTVVAVIVQETFQNAYKLIAFSDRYLFGVGHSSRRPYY